jgi:hypothetical protein
VKVIGHCGPTDKKVLSLRAGFYHLMRRRSLDLIEAKSRESTTFIETMRAVQSIKIVFQHGSETPPGKTTTC